AGMGMAKLAALSLIVLETIPDVSAAGQATLTDDAYIITALPTAHAGTANLLSVIGSTQKAFVKFTLSGLSSGGVGSDMAKATLTLWENVVATPGSVDIDRVTSAWTETGITANSAPTLGAVEAASVPVTTGNACVTADVTTLVQAWIDGVIADNGMAV